MNYQQRYKKIVIKVGSNVLSNDNGEMDKQLMHRLSQQISEIKKGGADVILVSSGAVACGRSLINLSVKADAVSSRQVFAAVGQVKLMNIYLELFNNESLNCAQVLVTKEDFRDRSHYMNMRNCFEALLQNNIIPIVNENDVISITELMFTDNDELAALIATMINAELLIILTNVDGLFDGDPKKPGSKVISVIDSKQDFSKYITNSKSDFGRGGMITKANMAQKVARNGITVKIANGKKADILKTLMSDHEQSSGSTFLPLKQISTTKKRIAFAETFAKGEIYINEGARRALFSTKASSLLVVGVTKIEGEFQKGDVVRILDENNELLGMGKAEYSDKKAREMVGQKNQKPLVHYDYLYLQG